MSNKNHILNKIAVLNNAYSYMYEWLFMPQVLFHMDIKFLFLDKMKTHKFNTKNFGGYILTLSDNFSKMRLQKFVSMNVWGIKSVAILRLFSNRSFLDLQIENFWIVECTLDPKEDDDYNTIKESSKLKFLKSIYCKYSYNQHNGRIFL